VIADAVAALRVGVGWREYLEHVSENRDGMLGLRQQYRLKANNQSKPRARLDDVHFGLR
jgi:hypothetical protein